MKQKLDKNNNDWATPPYFYEELNKKWKFDFDPCPFEHDTSLWDGLEIEWGSSNFINPPYSLDLKTKFVEKALMESKLGKLCVLLLPVSTSTKLFHDVIKPNAFLIEFIKGRIPFIGIDSEGNYVNWHLWDRKAPDGVNNIKRAGQNDSMVVIFYYDSYFLL